MPHKYILLSHITDPEVACVDLDHIALVTRDTLGTVTVTISVPFPGQGNKAEPGFFTFNPGAEADRFWGLAERQSLSRWRCDVWTE